MKRFPKSFILGIGFISIVLLSVGICVIRSNDDSSKVIKELKQTSGSSVPVGKSSKSANEASTVTAQLKTDLAALQAQLKDASPEKRQQILAEMRVKQQAMFEAIRKLHPAQFPTVRPSEAEIEARIAKTAPPELKDALIQRQKLMVELSAFKEGLKSKSAQEQGAAMAQWQQQRKADYEKIRIAMEAGSKALADRQPQLASAGKLALHGLPPDIKARMEQRNQAYAELNQLKEQYRSASPEERGRAIRDWYAANRDRLTGNIPVAGKTNEAAGKAGGT